MRTALLIAACLAAAPAFAQQDTRPPNLPDGAKEAIRSARIVEQDLPATIGKSPPIIRSGVKIYIATLAGAADNTGRTGAALDTGGIAIYSERPDTRLPACTEALGAALDRLAADAKSRGANAVVGVDSGYPGGVFPERQAYLCSESRVRGVNQPATVHRVRLTGWAVTLP